MKFATKHQIVSFVNGLVPPRAGHGILMYHAIYPKYHRTFDDIFSVSHENFIQQISYLKAHTDYSIISLGTCDNFSEKSLSITFDDGFSDNLHLAASVLTEYKLPFTIFIATDKIDTENYLSKNDLNKLAQIPYAEIGSHGKSHRPLTTLTNTEIQNELLESKKILEELTGKEIKSFSYPHGKRNFEIDTLARQYGYKNICTSKLGINHQNGTTLNRLPIFDCDTLKSFEQKVSGKWDWLSDYLM